MLSGVSIGQYYPGSSIIHRLDPRMKIILTTIYIVMLFVSYNLISLLVGVLLLAVIYPMAKIPIKTIGRSIKPILPIIAFTAILNMLFVQGDNIIFQWKIISISWDGIFMAIKMCLRIIALISGTSLLTYTTTPITLTDAIERLFSPLKKLHLPVHEVAMMMTIALRFIPTLIEETDKIMSAQKARGADMESGGLIDRAKALVPILIPLFVSAFRRADELALAMESRCYHGDVGRTRMKQMHMAAKDAYAVIFMLLALVFVIFLNGFAVSVGVLY